MKKHVIATFICIFFINCTITPNPKPPQIITGDPITPDYQTEDIYESNFIDSADTSPIDIYSYNEDYYNDDSSNDDSGEPDIPETPECLINNDCVFPEVCSEKNACVAIEQSEQIGDGNVCAQNADCINSVWGPYCARSEETDPTGLCQECLYEDMNNDGVADGCEDAGTGCGWGYFNTDQFGHRPVYYCTAYQPKSRLSIEIDNSISNQVLTETNHSQAVMRFSLTVEGAYAAPLVLSVLIETWNENGQPTLSMLNSSYISLKTIDNGMVYSSTENCWEFPPVSVNENVLENTWRFNIYNCDEFSPFTSLEEDETRDFEIIMDTLPLEINESLRLTLLADDDLEDNPQGYGSLDHHFMVWSDAAVMYWNGTWIDDLPLQSQVLTYQP